MPVQYSHRNYYEKYQTEAYFGTEVRLLITSSSSIYCASSLEKQHTYRRKSTSAQLLQPVFRHEVREFLSFFDRTSDLPLDPGGRVYANPGNLILTGFLSRLNSESVQITTFRFGEASSRLLSLFVSLLSDDFATRVE